MQATVLTFQDGSLTAVADDVAIRLTPFSNDSLAKSLRRRLTGPSVHAELAERNLQRVAEFSWQPLATEILNFNQRHGA